MVKAKQFICERTGSNNNYVQYVMLYKLIEIRIHILLYLIVSYV